MNDLHIIWCFLMDTFSIKEFGLNAATVGVLGTNFFTLFQGWSAWRQNKKIWESGGESVSVTMCSYFACYFPTFLIYALHHHDFTMTLNAIQGLLFFPIVLGLWMKKGFSIREWICLIVFALMIPVMWLASSEGKEIVFSLALGALVLSFLAQPYELWRSKHRGNLDPRFLFVYFTTGMFWLIYGVVINNPIIYIANGFGMTIFASTIMMYYHYDG